MANGPVLPNPPATLPRIPKRGMPTGTPMYRVFNQVFGALGFNPADNSAKTGRFHPFQAGGNGPYVPVLYAATDPLTCLYEVVLRDHVPRGPNPTFSLMKVRESRCADLECRRDLILVDLGPAAGRQLSLDPDAIRELTQGMDYTLVPPEHYRQGRLWAQALHDADPSIDGLSYRSRQGDNDCFVLFGDRVRAGDLGLVSSPYRLDQPPGLEYLEAAATRMGVRLEG